jgi:transposase
MPRRCKRLKIKENLDSMLDLLEKYKSNNMIYKRIKLIILCKKHETEGISKEELHRRTGFSGQSIINWQRLYEQGGIELLITHGRKSNRESIFTSSEQKRIIEKYSNDHISISGLRN